MVKIAEICVEAFSGGVDSGLYKSCRGINREKSLEILFWINKTFRPPHLMEDLCVFIFDTSWPSCALTAVVNLDIRYSDYLMYEWPSTLQLV